MLSDIEITYFAKVILKLGNKQQCSTIQQKTVFKRINYCRPTVYDKTKLSKL